MKDLYLDNFYKLDLYGKSSKKLYNRGKSFGYQVLGFGSGVAAGFLPTQRGIFASGYDYTLDGDFSTYYGVSNLVNSSGVVAGDVSAVMTVAAQGEAAGYGGDKGIIGFGSDASSNINRSNLVNNVGTVASDVTGVGTARREQSAATYGGDKAIFALGHGNAGQTGVSNLVSNVGVVATDTSAVAGARASAYDTELGEIGTGSIAGFYCGYSTAAGGDVTKKNIVSNVGIIASDANTSNISQKNGGSGCRFGSTGQGIIAYGSDGASNILSATGSASSVVSQVGNGAIGRAACAYGEDKGIFAYGDPLPPEASHLRWNTRNLVNNSGVIASDAAGAGTVRSQPVACEYSTVAN